MPIHDWTRVDAGLFHAFRCGWISALCDALNGSALPKDYFALIEQNGRGRIPKVLTLHLPQTPEGLVDASGGLAVATAPHPGRVIRRSEAGLYADNADFITVRNLDGDVAAAVEIVSPGNKSNLPVFVKRCIALLRHRVHLLVIDPFPPGPRDPRGVHQAIWDQFEDEELTRPAGKQLTLASYDAGPPQVAYVNWVAVGDVLPDMPIFLQPETYVPAPLDATYQTAWGVFPAALRGLLEPAR